MRAATLVKELRADRDDDWVLVLPPWPHLYHWKSRSVRQSNVKWESFFDLPSLNEDVPSVEFEEYATLEEWRGSCGHFLPVISGMRVVVKPITDKQRNSNMGTSLHPNTVPLHDCRLPDAPPSPASCTWWYGV